jgi:hypothetical protein
MKTAFLLALVASAAVAVLASDECVKLAAALQVRDRERGGELFATRVGNSGPDRGHTTFRPPSSPLCAPDATRQTLPRTRRVGVH